MSDGKRTRPSRGQDEKKPIDKKTLMTGLYRILALIAVTAIIFCLYRFLIGYYFFEITLGIYMGVAAALVLAYVIYNRGFSRRGVTEDMLPDDWDEDKKKEFIEDGERRLKRSRPILFLIFAFFFTFVMDILELYALPIIQEIFGA